MKIIHIVTSFDLGGSERVAINIASSKHPSFQYELIEVVRGKGMFSEYVKKELHDKKIKYYCSPITNRKLGIIFFPFWFLLIFLKSKPHVIHTHTEIPDLSWCWFIRLFGWLLPSVKWVRTIHNTELWNDWKFIGKIVEPVFQKHQANVAISKSTRYCYQKNYGLCPPIIYNGISESKQKSFPYIVKDKINVLFAGRLEPQKGIEQLIDIVNFLRDDKRYIFHIIGNGSLQSILKRQTSQLNNVRFYDKVHGLSAYMSSFDYLLMPSNFEGLALTSIEASFAKIPTIINACMGLDETLPSDWPLKVTNNSVKQFVHLFRDVLPNVDRNKLGEKAYHFVSENFRIDTMQQEYERVYASK
jgi:glycosyltransferase involved in cell wall biosynthesis